MWTDNINIKILKMLSSYFYLLLWNISLYKKNIKISVYTTLYLFRLFRFFKLFRFFLHFYCWLTFFFILSTRSLFTLSFLWFRFLLLIQFYRCTILTYWFFLRFLWLSLFNCTITQWNVIIFLKLSIWHRHHKKSLQNILNPVF